jgi:ATP-dependent DNA helicase UvrD/PcrA
VRSSSQITLDDRQLAAIEHVHGPMLVVAGAGTGKTLVLTHRIARLISEGHAQPGEILAVTYTENAAQELRQRVEKIVGKNASGLRATTFHGYCFGLLHRHGRGFKVIDRPDLWVFLRRRMAELELRQFIKAANPAEFLDDLLVFFERCQDELVSPADYEAYLERVRSGELPLPRVAKSKHMADLPREDALARCEEIARVFTTVERMLKERGLGTFGHMIVHAVDLLRGDPELLEQERRRARFILIDEFQDSNVGQIELAKLLAGEQQNIFAVGDPDQAIYRFRGATSGAFDEFLRRFSAPGLVALERNHRSRANILSCAFAVISRNPQLVQPGNSAGLKFNRQPLLSAREQSLDVTDSSRSLQVRVVVSPAAETEAADIADSIQQLRRLRRTRWKEFAVLYRSHRHRDRLAQELAERDIPFVVGGLDVLETTPVRDLLAVLRAASGRDDAASLVRVSALPAFHINPETLRSAFVEAGRDCKAAEVIRSVPGGVPVIEAVEQTRREIALRKMKVSEVLAYVMGKFKLEASEPSLKTFCEFAALWQEKPITERGDLPELLEYLDFFVAAGGAVALPEPSEDTDAVRLLTAHSAKGLEFEHVFVIRLNTSSFPAYYREPFFAFPNELRHSAIESREEKLLHMEEERRLLYVAMTRAKDTLALYAKPGFGKDSTPSGFLRELIKEKNIAGMLTYHAARPQQIDLPVPVPPETISNVAPWVLMPAREALQKLTLSATAIEMYERCPLQFKMAHDWRLPGEAVAAMHFGSAMHTALKRFFDSARSGKMPAVADALQMFEEALQATAVDDPLQRELYRKQGIRQLRAFVEGVHSDRPLQVLDTERSFRVEVGGTMVTGRVDRLDAIGGEGEAAITDYKTGSPRSQEDADKSLQLSLYALAAQRAWNLDPQSLIFYNLETNVAIKTARSAEDLREAEERVREVAASIADGMFEAKPAAMKCRYCAYRSLCPATEQKLYTIEHAAYAAARTS